ncbi:hypothetical protein EDD85DRAFT_212454 [Armillaria nabsnona]|nr:hypothetical protein EDD85DRAFT_212454 [Armillaria nabsnona]
MAFMIPVLLYVSLFTHIMAVSSLVITVPTQSHPRVNDSTSVLLTWSSDDLDPSHFFIAVRIMFSPDYNMTSFIQPVENFTATCNVSVVFRYAGKTFIEAIKASPTQADSNVTFASTDPFQVDEAPSTDTFSGVSTGGIFPSTSSDSGSAPVVSTTVSSMISPVSRSATVTTA